MRNKVEYFLVPVAGCFFEGRYRRMISLDDRNSYLFKSRTSYLIISCTNADYEWRERGCASIMVDYTSVCV